MKAINLHRRDRAIRFGGVGAMLGATIILALLIVLNLFAVLLGHAPFPRSVDEVLLAITRAGVLAAIFGVAGVAIGVTTARISARIWAWRVLGVAVILASVAMFLWVWAIATPDAFGWAIIGIVCLAGVVSGINVITRAREAGIGSL